MSITYKQKMNNNKFINLEKKTSEKLKENSN